MKKNSTNFKSAMMLICALLLVPFGMAQRTEIAGWSFPAIPADGTTYHSDCGEGMIYLDGTHGSSQWTIVESSNNASNVAYYVTNGLHLSSTITACNDETTGKALTLVGCDDSCAVFVFAGSPPGMILQSSVLFNWRVVRYNTGWRGPGAGPWRKTGKRCSVRQCG